MHAATTEDSTNEPTTGATPSHTNEARNPDRGQPGRDDATRAEALRLLQPFVQRILPVIVRRIANRRGAVLAARLELEAEVRQELALDSLEHADEVCRLDERGRHSRWFRLTERTAYRLRSRGESATAEGPVELPAAPPPTVLAPVDHALAHRLGSGADLLANGRCNLRATGQRVGASARAVRTAWAELVERLGYDAEHWQFWRRRLAEALLGLAADLLRIHADLPLWPRPRPAPDPSRRVQRVRRIRDQFLVGPMPPDVKRALAPWIRRPRFDRRSPGQLLAAAAALDPENPAVPLWQYEAAMLDGDHRAAARAVRATRRIGGADPIAVALARARLLEERARIAAARRVLLAARQRRPQDPRLQAALLALTAR